MPVLHADPSRTHLPETGIYVRAHLHDWAADQAQHFQKEQTR